jgi:hypothetical protein
MKLTIPKTIEDLFTMVVALDHTPTMSNAIYLNRKSLYMLNFDNTLLFRIKLKDTDPTFEPIGFWANDYDSANMELVDGKIVFTRVSSTALYERKKYTNGTNLTPGTIAKLWNKYVEQRKSVKTVKVNLHRSVTELIDDSLSHIEISGRKGEHIILTQRNVYSGDVAHIVERGRGFITPDPISASIEPLGVRTRDFLAMFSISESLDFYFSTKGTTFPIRIYSSSGVREFGGWIAPCLYKEIIDMKEGYVDGR